MAGSADVDSVQGGTHMTILWMALPAVAAVLTLWAISRVEKWLERRASKKFHRGIIYVNPPAGPVASSGLYPESLFLVEVTEAGVTCTRPDRKVESVRWDDLQRVEILNTEDGPSRPDVFWVLHGTDTGCVIPQGATGEQALLHRLQDLPGFDNGVVIQAMTQTRAGRVQCWSRPAGVA